MTRLTALEISTNWPDNILISSFENEETGKHGSVMYMLRNGSIHKMMLTLNAVYPTKEESKEKMNSLAEFAIDFINDKNPAAPNLTPSKS